MIRTDLMQVDTYRRQSRGEVEDKRRAHTAGWPGSWSQRLLAPVSTCSKCLRQAWLSIGTVSCNKVASDQPSDSPRKDPSKRIEKAEFLYENERWRCALEVIVDHEVQEFVKDELFQRLIKEKWDRFGWKMYMKRTVAPYLLLLACLLSVAYLRGNEINAAWPHLSSNGDSDSSVTVLCLRSANMSSPAALLAWIAAELPADGLSASFSFATLVMNLLLVVVGVPFLLWKGWRQRRFRIQDLDTNADANISFDEIMLFIQKNLHFILDITGAALILSAAAARIMCKDSHELNLLAAASIVLCFNFINVMLPFRFFGPLAIMMYKILREDVCHLLSIYSFMLVGFGVGLFLLFQRPGRLLGCDLPGADGCSPDEEPYVFQDVFSSILWLVWVSLGDSVGGIQVLPSSRSYELHVDFL
jgi:hypothetical protein